MVIKYDLAYWKFFCLKFTAKGIAHTNKIKIKAPQFPMKILIGKLSILDDSAPSPNANQYPIGIANTYKKVHKRTDEMSTKEKCQKEILDFNICFML